MSDLTKDDIEVGKTYRAKRPQRIGPLYNDRTVIYKGYRTLQYDGIAVKIGQKYPVTTIEKFLKWAGSIVEEEA